MKPDPAERKAPVKKKKVKRELASFFSPPRPDEEMQAWTEALAWAKKGDPKILAHKLRDPGGLNPTVPASVRVWLADLLEGKASVPTKRGIKSRLGYHDRQTIQFTAQLIESTDPRKKAKLIRAFAERYAASESTIRDVIARRKTFFAEK